MDEAGARTVQWQSSSLLFKSTRTNSRCPLPAWVGPCQRTGTAILWAGYRDQSQPRASGVRVGDLIWGGGVRVHAVTVPSRRDLTTTP